MADSTKEATETKVEKSASEQIAEVFGEMTTVVKSLKDDIANVKEDVKKAAEVRYPFGSPGGVAPGHAPNGIVDPDRMSRPYSLMLVAKRLRMQRNNDQGWQNVAKNEANLSEELQKAYYGQAKWQDYSSGEFIVPLGTDLMPFEDRVVEKEGGGTVVVAGVPQELRKRCRDMMIGGAADLDEIAWLEKRMGYPLLKGASFGVSKDLSANVGTAGGTLVAEAAQGELIGVLRAQEVVSRVGARQIDLPPQGSINFPRVTASVTVSATTEAATVAESTPTTGQLKLVAKPYSTFTDIPEELFMFASVSVDAWLRTEMTREAALKIDRDAINGAGGSAIQGLINYSGVNLRVASTTGANGDTLDPEDLILLLGDIADQNAPVDQGFFYLLTNSLWAGFSTRKASSSGEFMFSISTAAAGGGRPQMALNGNLVVGTTQVPTNRVKGSGTTLTLALAGVGSEIIIARAGVISIKMTDSDGTKFQQRLSTMRCTQYADLGPAHEQSFGFIDDLLNS